MSNIKTLSITMTAGSANAISLTQTPGGAGNLTINGALASGGVATLDVARRVTIVSTGDISNRTFTITGTDRYGNSQSETITGPNNATVYTTKDFKTVTQIAISGSAGAALTSGTNGIASTQWYPADYKRNGTVLLFVALSTGASLTYTIEQTSTNLNDTTLSPFSAQITQAQNAVVFPSSDSTVVNASTNEISNFISAPAGIRLTSNSFSSGTATLTIITGNTHTI
jgi:VCBS repeat-containing protein